jgi:VIT1/CCC1 family predicted Fe2+/Mn2+ transporter
MMLPRAPAIFGFADGTVCAIGIIAGLAVTHQDARAIWAAAFSAGLAEFAGMAAGQYQSAPEDGKIAALICGLASAAGAVLPAVPYLIASGAAALTCSVVIAALLCAGIAWLRPDHQGGRAYVQSYGVMIAAAGLCLLGGLIPA